MKCEFCGLSFQKEECQSGCGGCPMSKGCKKMKCPNCNYEILPEPDFKLFKKLKLFIHKLFSRVGYMQENKPVDRTLYDAVNRPLTSLKVNEKASIVEIKADNAIKLRKLTAFSIIPGFDIIILQKYPAYIVQVGFTQIALDQDMASLIIVK